MTTRQLAMQWWNDKISWTKKGLLMEGDFKHRHPQSLTGSEIENIFYNEVVLKWINSLPFDIHFDLLIQDRDSRNGEIVDNITTNKSIYVKEHTKEELTLDEEIAELEEELWNSPTGTPESLGKPKSVDNNIEFNKWLKDKKQRYLENKEECYQDILSSTTSAIDQYLKSPYQAQKGVLESAVKCNEMFLNFCDEQPKEEVDVWDEMINKLNDLTFENITSENPLSKNDYSKWISEQMKQHYTLVKKL